MTLDYTLGRLGNPDWNRLPPPPGQQAPGVCKARHQCSPAQGRRLHSEPGWVGWVGALVDAFVGGYTWSSVAKEVHLPLGATLELFHMLCCVRLHRGWASRRQWGDSASAGPEACCCLGREGGACIGGVPGGVGRTGTCGGAAAGERLICVRACVRAYVCPGEGGNCREPHGTKGPGGGAGGMAVLQGGGCIMYTGGC